MRGARGLLAAGLLGLAACATPIGSGDVALAGSSWHRTDDDDASPHYATMTFTSDAASGYAGCNTWNARAIGGATDVRRGALTFGPVSTTRMMCPPSSMDTEHKFLPVLARVRRFEWRPIESGAELHLLDGHGVLLATFECDSGCPAESVSASSRR
jgi:heat shock protein HslJ